MRSPSSLLLICGVIMSYASSAQELHVAPNGNDQNSGSLQQPLRTIEAARDAVRHLNREMTGDITVFIHDGEYPVRETIQFDAHDSGLNGHRVIYRAYGEDKPIFTGGVTIENWTLHDKDRGIYRAPAPETVFRQIYLDGEPAIRARTPNRTSDASFGPYFRVNVPRKPECLIAAADWEPCEQVTDLSAVELILESHWYHQRLRIGETRVTDEGVIVLPGQPQGKMSKVLRFYNDSYGYLENALQFLDAPGEWYHDPAAGVLYLRPPEGRRPDELRVEVPVTEVLVSISGSAEDPVKNLEFRGLTFQCSNWSSPSHRGLNVTQFAQPIGVSRAWESRDYPLGMVRARHARNIAWRHCIVRQAGATGIQLYADVDDAELEGNDIYEIAANAVEIDAHAAKNPPPEKQSTGVAVWNNHIWKAGQNYTNGGGILAHNVRGLIIEHNHVHNMPYSGMQIGNQPGRMQDIGCGDNRIRFNHVHHCMQLHDDGGGIYTLGGTQEGTVIADNYVHDIVRSKWAGTYKIDLIYLDNHSSKILVKDNVVNGGRAAERNGSKGNTLVNNLQNNPEVEKNAGVKPGYHPRHQPE